MTFGFWKKKILKLRKMAVAAMAVKKQRKQAEQRALQIQVRPEQVKLEFQLK